MNYFVILAISMMIITPLALNEAFGQMFGTNPVNPNTFNGGTIGWNGKLIYPPQSVDPSGKSYNDLNGAYGGVSTEDYVPPNLDSNNDGEITPADPYAGYNKNSGKGESGDLIPPWFKKLLSKLKEFFGGGDPLLLVLPDRIINQTALDISHYKGWDIQGHSYQNRLAYLNCNDKVNMVDREIIGTPYLYLDLDGNNKITDCRELLAHDDFTFAELLISESYINKPFGYITSEDRIFEYIKVNDFVENIELGIKWIKLAEPENIENDYVSERFDCRCGSYIGGISNYKNDTAFQNAYEKGWIPKTYEENQHFRAIQKITIMTEKYGLINGYSSILGFINP